MKIGSDRKYTPELRAAAVKQVMDGGRSVPAVFLCARGRLVERLNAARLLGPAIRPE